MSKSDLGLIGIWYKIDGDTFKFGIRGHGIIYQNFWDYINRLGRDEPGMLTDHWTDFPWAGFSTKNTAFLPYFKKTYPGEVYENTDV